MTSAMPSSSIAALLRDFTRGFDSSSMAPMRREDTPCKGADCKYVEASSPRPQEDSHGKGKKASEAPAERRNSSAPCGPSASPGWRRNTMLHANVCEEGGLTMVELAQAMRVDAKAQEFISLVIAEMLEETIARNDARGRSGQLPSFEGSRAPISPSSYVKRIQRYGGCSPCCFVVGVLYLERLKRRHTRMCLTSRNFQRLFLTAVMVAAKYLDDFYYSNKHWAEVAGLTTAELNALELELLFRMDFNLSITREDYDDFTSQLVGDDDDEPKPSNAAFSPQSPKLEDFWQVGEHAGQHANMGGKKVSSVDLVAMDQGDAAKPSEQEFLDAPPRRAPPAAPPGIE